LSTLYTLISIESIGFTKKNVFCSTYYLRRLPGLAGDNSDRPADKLLYCGKLERLLECSGLCWNSSKNLVFKSFLNNIKQSFHVIFGQNDTLLSRPTSISSSKNGMNICHKLTTEFL